MNNQSTYQQKEGQKIDVPIIIRVYSIFLLLDGIFSLLLAIPLLALGGLGIITGSIGILKIIISLGIRQMKKWSLYLFTVAGLIGITMLIINKKDIFNMLIIIIELVFLVYFWSIRDKFVK